MNDTDIAKVIGNSYSSENTDDWLETTL
jgi:hypothetical protein